MQSLLIEEHGRVLSLTINRPHVRNAMDFDTADQIAAAMDMLDARDDLSVAVITGAEGSFCAGMDLKAFAEGKRSAVPGRGFAGITEAPPRKILIAAIEGYALAGGFELALACDLIVSSREAKFGMPEVKRGLVAAAGGLLRLPQQIPYHIAMEYALTGDLFTAARANELGLINRLTEPGEALATALKLAQDIAANGPLAVTATKRIVTEAADWKTDEMFARQKVLTEPVFLSEDAREGTTAFKEKRPPVWRAR